MGHADLTESSTSDVSRFKGQAFSTLAKGASWFGIVVLGLLLTVVVIDALGLDEAGQYWYASALLGFGIPVVAYGLYLLRRRRAAGFVAIKSLVLAVAGLLGTGGLFILFVVLEHYHWYFAYSIGLLPAAAIYLHYREIDARAPLYAVAVGVVGVLASVVIAGVVPYHPRPWLTYVWTFVVPIALGMAWAHGSTRRSRSIIAGSIVVGGLVAALIVPLLAPISPAVASLAYVALVLPSARYAGLVLERRRESWPGLASPIVILFGIGATSVIADSISAEGPDVWLDWQFLTSAPSGFPEQAGLYPAIVGSVFIIIIVAILSFVVGVGAAIYLEEYAPSTGIVGLLTRIIRINIANLAGVPSVVYGLLGLGLFVNLLGMGLGIVIVAALTLTLLILPIVIISAQEAIRSVPTDVREASFGMGATRWQTIRNVVLPRAVPGILTGTILALSRAIGETAPLLMIGAATTVFTPPEALTNQVSAMPLQVFYWSFAAKSGFRESVAPAGVVTLLVVMLSMNAIAIYLRNRYEQRT